MRAALDRLRSFKRSVKSNTIIGYYDETICSQCQHKLTNTLKNGNPDGGITCLNCSWDETVR